MSKVKILPQPDYTSCGPTSLHAVYEYLGYQIDLSQLIDDITQFEKGGGTLGVILANHALGRQFDVELYTYNLAVFDPSWFLLSNKEMVLKLEERLNQRENSAKEETALRSYIDFAKNGGKLRFQDISKQLLRDLLEFNGPFIVGLNATWLYQSKREDSITCEYDDILGDPSGHFVVLSGLINDGKHIEIADPYKSNPISGSCYYQLEFERVINAILLGVMTFDGNMLIIKRK